MSREDEKNIFERFLKGLLSSEKRSDNSAFEIVESSLDNIGKGDYGKPYEELSLEQRLGVLSKFSESFTGSLGEGVKGQIQQARDAISAVPSSSDELEKDNQGKQSENKPDEVRWFSDLKQRRKVRNIGKKIAEEQEAIISDLRKKRIESEKAPQLTEEDLKALAVSEILKQSLYESAREELTAEILAKKVAFLADIEERRLSDEEKEKAMREFDAGISKAKGEDDPYGELLEKELAKEEAETFLRASPEQKKIIIGVLEENYEGPFDSLRQDFKLDLQVKKIETDEVVHSELTDEQREEMFERIMDEQIDPLLALVEDDSSFTQQMQFTNVSFQKLMRLLYDDLLPQIKDSKLRAEIVERVNTIFALHDIYLAMRYWNNHESPEILIKRMRELSFQQLVGEMARKINGVEAPIGHVVNVVDQFVGEILLGKEEKERIFSESDFLKLEEKLKEFVFSLYEEQGRNVDNETVEKIVRRGIRISMARLDLQESIARYSSIKYLLDDPRRWENFIFNPFMNIWRFGDIATKWGYSSPEELKKVFDFLGGTQGLNRIVGDPLSSIRSSSWRNEELIRLLAEHNNPMLGLSLRIFQGGDEGKQAIEVALGKYEYMILFLRMFQDDSDLKRILESYGYESLSKFEEKFSVPFYLSIQHQLFGDNDAPKIRRETAELLEKNLPLFNALLSFLNQRRDMIFKNLDPESDHGYLMKRPFSFIPDVPYQLLQHGEFMEKNIDYWNRAIGDFMSAIKISDAIREYVIKNPQEVVHRISEIQTAYEQLQGREGAAKTILKISRAVVALSSARGVLAYTPQWFRDVARFLGFRITPLQNIRPYVVEVTPEMWQEKFQEMTAAGNIPPELLKEFRRVYKATWSHKIVPIVINIGVAAGVGLFLILVAEAFDAIKDEAGGGGSH